MFQIEQQTIVDAKFKGQYFVRCQGGYLHKDGTVCIGTCRNGVYSGYFNNLAEVAAALTLYEKELYKVTLSCEGPALTKDGEIILKGFGCEGASLIAKLAKVLNEGRSLEGGKVMEDALRKIIVLTQGGVDNSDINAIDRMARVALSIHLGVDLPNNWTPDWQTSSDPILGGRRNATV